MSATNKLDSDTFSAALRQLVERRKQAKKNEIVIAHLSDLHFTSDMTWPGGTDADLLEALVIDISDHQPDIIVVTGDVADNDTKNATQEDLKKAFENARGFLEDLCYKCGELRPLTSLFVIPGNHDARILGNFLRQDVDKVYGSWYLRTGLKLLSRAFAKHLPSGAKDHVQNLFRCKMDEALQPTEQSDLQIFKNIFAPYCESKPLEPLGLYLFCIDSNTEDAILNFARGLVTLPEINKLRKEADQWKAKFGENYEAGFKIALVHHHPMPIPETEANKSTEDESFVLLKNAGTLLKTLMEREIDFVLHGHQHCPGYSKAAYPASGGEPRLIGIVGAGSVRKPYQGRYSYNVLTWQMGGGWEVRRRIKTEGQGGYEKQDEKIFALLTKQERHERLYNALIKKRPPEAMITDASMDIVIDSSGDVQRHIRWLRITPPPTEPSLDNISFSVETESDVVYYSHESSPGYPQGKNSSKAKNKLNLVFTFSSAVTNENSQNLDFKVMGENAYLFSQDYCQKYKKYKGSPQDFENFRFSTRKAYEHLDIRIQFPKGLPPLDPKLEVFKSEEENERDLDEEMYLRNNWRYYSDPQRPTIFFSVDRPLSGYVYMFRWDLPTTEFDLIPKENRDYVRGAVEQICDLVRRRFGPGERNKLEEALRSLVTAFLGANSPLDKHIGIDIAFEQDGQLQIPVSTQWNQKSACWIDGPVDRPKSPLGQHIRGGAFLSKAFMAATPNKRSRVSEEEREVKWQFAYPVLYPPEPERGVRIAVITVWSYDANSILSTMVRPSLEQQRAVTNISDFVYVLGDVFNTPLSRDRS